MNLKKLIKNLKADSRPEKKYKKDLWRELDHRFDEMYPGAIKQFLPRRALVTALVVVLLLSVGSSAYAYDSPEVVEGHPLHFLKDKIEKLEGKIKFTPEQRAAWHLKMQERRMEEGEYMADHKKMNNQIFQKGINEMHKGFEECQKISIKEKRQMMFEKLSMMEKTQIEMLQRIKPDLPEHSQEMIDYMIADHTRRFQEQVKLLNEDEKNNFEPIKYRRFQIWHLGQPTVSNSPEVITASDLPNFASGNVRIILIGN